MTVDESSEHSRIWVIRPGRRGGLEEMRSSEEVFFGDSIAGLEDSYAIGDVNAGDTTQESAKASLSERIPDLHVVAVRTVVANVFRLACDVQVEDFIICPSRLQRLYRVGIVKSDYCFDATLKFPHFRTVEWIGEISKNTLTAECQRELGAARLFFECKRTSSLIAKHIDRLVAKASENG